jgi:hypothetical protein
MLNILDSRTLRSGSTHQDLMNDLAPILKNKWNSVTIVNDTTITANVKEIHLSDEVYIELPSAGTSVNYCHTTLGYTTGRNHASNNCYKIVETDDAVMIVENAANLWNTCTVIGVTSVPGENTTSLGAVIMTAGTSLVAYTDNMTDTATTAIGNNYATAPRYNEQYVPFVPWYNKETFEKVYMVTARKSSTNGETLLNGTDYFYVCGALAAKYTP